MWKSNNYSKKENHWTVGQIRVYFKNNEKTVTTFFELVGLSRYTICFKTITFELSRKYSCLQNLTYSVNCFIKLFKKIKSVCTKIGKDFIAKILYFLFLKESSLFKRISFLLENFHPLKIKSCCDNVAALILTLQILSWKCYYEQRRI